MALRRTLCNIVWLFMAIGHTGPSLSCSGSEHALPARRRTITNTQIQSLIPRSFEYYQAKVYEFLEYLYGYKVRHVVVQPMSPTDTTLDGNYPAYAKNKFIRLNMDVLQRYSESDNLFICAHEAAHQFCGHTYPSRKPYEPQAIEREADETAAQMLCAHGYRWVVEEYTRQLRKDVMNGYGDVSDGIHPSSAEKVAYLQPILQHDGQSVPADTALATTRLNHTAATATIPSLIAYLKNTLSSLIVLR